MLPLLDEKHSISRVRGQPTDYRRGPVAVVAAVAISFAPSAIPTPAPYGEEPSAISTFASGHAARSPTDNVNCCGLGAGSSYRIAEFASAAHLGQRDRNLSSDGLCLLVVAPRESPGALVLAFS